VVRAETTICRVELLQFRSDEAVDPQTVRDISNCVQPLACEIECLQGVFVGTIQVAGRVVLLDDTIQLVGVHLYFVVFGCELG